MKWISGNVKRSVMLAVALAAVVAGAIVATVDSGGSSPARGTATGASSSQRAHGRGTLAVAAAYLGLSREQLRTQLRQGRTLAQIADATAGRSSTGLIDTLYEAQVERVHARADLHRLSPTREASRLAQLHSRIVAEVQRPETARGVTDSGSQELSAAARYLGLDARQLRQQLRSGRSLAQVAQASAGKSEAGLIEALVAERRARIEAERSAGTIDAQQAEKLLAGVHGRVAKLVTAS